ncbi:sulfate adenylyltransferase subunit 1 [Allopusillimonas ginsengisoli]|uniref:sulfate adenylyltransferase subunit 1 n=1 Tax=Allopusillimonas ginsengisoli TaxID=453575 RepID=UPI0039C0C4AA
MNAINEQFIQNHDRSVLRFITAGSVDDGKSTLIGRLLYDSKGVFADQLQAIKNSRYHRNEDGMPNLAMLTDGLEAEREQGITIDVAYRYFATPQRKFIVADAPGHEQYTRNMVTGASTAHAAIILVDATKVKDGQLLIQTWRHSTISCLLGIRHIIFAVNKLDLLGWDETLFQELAQACGALSRQLGIAQHHVIPVSALHGDNVVNASPNTSWYQGVALLPLLEGLSADDNLSYKPLRFAVQWVARHHGQYAHGFRGYAGQLASGTMRVGDRLVVRPSGVVATIKSLRNFQGLVDEAHAGAPVTVELNEDVDVSRGDWLTHEHDAPTVGKQIEAELCWLDAEPLNLARRYLIRHGTHTCTAKISQVHTVRDLQQLAVHAANNLTLGMNDIGRVTLRSSDALVTDPYEVLAATGAFILIDETSHQTVAAGLIRKAGWHFPAIPDGTLHVV